MTSLSRRKPRTIHPVRIIPARMSGSCVLVLLLGLSAGLASARQPDGVDEPRLPIAPLPIAPLPIAPLPAATQPAPSQVIPTFPEQPLPVVSSPLATQSAQPAQAAHPAPLPSMQPLPPALVTPEPTGAPRLLPTTMPAVSAPAQRSDQATAASVPQMQVIPRSPIATVRPALPAETGALGVPMSHQQPITPVRYQRREGDSEDTRMTYQIQVEPPGLDRLSRLDSEAKFQERVRQESLSYDSTEKTMFPEEPILSRETYYGRGGIWPERKLVVEPHYVCYKRLFFHDINAERYGWDLGPLHPMLATGKFFYDLALFPMRAASRPFEGDCNLGYCLPGDPVPFKFYPPEITFPGTVAELAVIGAMVAIFP